MTAQPYDPRECEEEAPMPPPAETEGQTPRRGKSRPRLVGTDEADPRPVVSISTELHENVAAAAAALAGDPDLYQRAGQLVHVVRVPEGGAEREKMAPDSPQIRPLPPALMGPCLSKVAIFEKYDKRTESHRKTTPPGSVTAAVFSLGEWPGVRALTSISEAPVLRPDGTILATPGFDRVTGCLYLPSADFPPVSERPTQAEARAALDELADVWADFAWPDAGALYVPVALTMTILARPAIAGPTPGFAFDASAAGSGKGKAAQCAVIIATGREAANLTWPVREEETEKTLGALALRGATVALFDNVEGSFGGASLDRALTTGDRIALRILGRSEAPELPWNAVVIATGNGIELGSDTSRRVLVARQEPRTDRPEERTGPAPGRTWMHDPLLPWVRENRPRLVWAALTILRGWFVAGQPSMDCGTWGSFEEWARIIPPALRWAGGENVLSCRARERGGDEEARMLEGFLDGWARLFPKGGTARSAIDCLYPRERLRGEDLPPDGFDAVRDAVEAWTRCRAGEKPSPRRLGIQMRRRRGRVAGGRELQPVEIGGDSNTWISREVAL